MKAAIGVMNSMISGLDYTVIDGFSSLFVINGDIIQFEEVEIALVFSLTFIYWILILLLVLLIRLHTKLGLPPITKLPL